MNLCGRKLTRIEVQHEILQLFNRVADDSNAREALSAKFISALTRVGLDNIDNRPVIEDDIVS